MVSSLNRGHDMIMNLNRGHGMVVSFNNHRKSAEKSPTRKIISNVMKVSRNSARRTFVNLLKFQGIPNVCKSC